MSRRVLPPLVLFLLCGTCLLGLGGLAGCSDADRRTTAEMDEPDFRRGQELVKSGRNQEALVAFQKVIARRLDDAPESHLELGLLYLQHIKDPVPAIYHFNEYIRLRPNSAQATFVRQRIDAARREFAHTLPAQPLDNQFERLDLMAALDRLKQENEALKEQLAALKGGRAEDGATIRPGSAVPAPAAPEPARAASRPEEPPPPLSFQIGWLSGEVPTVRARSPGAGRTPASVPVVAPPRRTSAAPTVSLPPVRTSAAAPNVGVAPGRDARPPPSPPVAAPKTGRAHTVGPGDTLMVLALRYYGSRSRWKEILEANRDQLPSENTPLKIGMKLKIP